MYWMNATDKGERMSSMVQTDIYKDIAARTGGSIFLGVVGPVRSGKSTFIKKFMETLVVPNIESEFQRGRTIDEIPQSAAGKTIMTTEPKFVPEEGVRVSLNENTDINVRLIDCVGYIVPSAIGYIEEGAPRMVMTPWFDEPVPFNMAAELGTRKVITDHSTIGVVVTTDGSISDIPRAEYEEAEERVIRELQEIEKPFVVLLNCVDPYTKAAEELRQSLSAKYNVPVVLVNCVDLDLEKIKEILTDLLYQFPVQQVAVDLPGWIVRLAPDHWLKKAVMAALRDAFTDVLHISDMHAAAKQTAGCPYVDRCDVGSVELGTGSAAIAIAVSDELFYRVLREETDLPIEDEATLMSVLQSLSETQKVYDKLKGALDEVEATGYGIVMPTIDEMKLAEPEIVRQGGKYGVRLQASAPSIHMMRADIMTEVAPIVGSEKQSEELVMYLLGEFEESPQKIWESNIFGKSLHELVNEGLHNKLYRMPTEARMKLQETVERIINEGCSGLICIIL